MGRETAGTETLEIETVGRPADLEDVDLPGLADVVLVGLAGLTDLVLVGLAGLTDLVLVGLPGLTDFELCPGLTLVFIVVGLAGLPVLPVEEAPGTPGMPVGRTTGTDRLAPTEMVGLMMVVPDALGTETEAETVTPWPFDVVAALV